MPSCKKWAEQIPRSPLEEAERDNLLENWFQVGVSSRMPHFVPQSDMLEAPMPRLARKAASHVCWQSEMGRKVAIRSSKTP
jgi:hypothetical protein